MVKSWPMLSLRTISVLMAMQQQGSVSLDHVTTKGRADVPSLGCPLGPCDIQQLALPLVCCEVAWTIKKHLSPPLPLTTCGRQESYSTHTTTTTSPPTPRS